MTDKETLLYFLELPLCSSERVFDKFRYHQRAIFRGHHSVPKKRFIYIHGSLREKIVLVAHAVTFFVKEYDFLQLDHDILEEDGCIKGAGGNAFGADVRAGCAMLYLMSYSGHSLLITDGEEYRQTGSKWLMHHNPAIAARINGHQFIILLDLNGASSFKCYHVGTDAFRKYIADNTGYSAPVRESHTNIQNLCRQIAVVNFSINYHNEHTGDEQLNIQVWQNSL